LAVALKIESGSWKYNTQQYPGDPYMECLARFNPKHHPTVEKYMMKYILIRNIGWNMRIPHWSKRFPDLFADTEKNKMKPTNPNAHTYVNGTDVKTHGYAVTRNTFLEKFIWTVLYMFPLLPVCSVEWKV